MNYILFLIPVVTFLIAKVALRRTVNFQEVFVGIMVSAVLSVSVTYISKYRKMQSVEILNGSVISKPQVKKNCPEPDFDGWTSTYSSFCSAYDTEERHVGDICTTSSEGVTSCTPVYETYYKYFFPFEKRWYVKSTLATWEIDRVGGRYKQGLKEPKRWSIVKIDDPVSKNNGYTNYVKAAPDSMFNGANITGKYGSKVPNYPRIHDIYNVNRVITVGYKGDLNIKKLNYDLGKALGVLNPAKQVNIILILTNIPDPAYRHSVEYKWVGGNKNDVVIFISADKNGNVLWSDVMTFGKNKFNGIFTEMLVGAISDMEKVNEANQKLLVDNIRSLTYKHYDRPQMKDYEYLKHEIKPTTGALVVAFILNVILSVTFLVIFHHKEFDPIGEIRSELSRRRRIGRFKKR